MMTDARLAPREPSITGLKLEINEDRDTLNAVTADTDTALVSHEPSVTSLKPEIDDNDEGLPDAATAETTLTSREPSVAGIDLKQGVDQKLPNADIPNGTLVPRELTIASLDLGKDDQDFADGIACVQAYWEQASQMDENTQEQMRHLIITKQFALSLSARQTITKHRLYRGLTRKDETNTWPIFLMLKAMYKSLPQSYVHKLRAKGFVVDTVDHTSDYMAAYPDTIRPRVFDTDTRKGREYRGMWPSLKNTPTIYRKSRARNDKQPDSKQPNATATEATVKTKPATIAPRDTASNRATSPLLKPATIAASTCSTARQSDRRGKKRPAADPTGDIPTKRSSTREDDFEFDSVLMQMTLPGVPSGSTAKVDVEKEIADLKEEMAKMRQQTHMFMKVTADVVTSMKTEIEDLKEGIKALKK
ncbi:uncharacterized protein Triagg1_8964 [Trichoderma aggressivum f. europaeum]|uniref:Uncharacterized protein n=1 Tax=Trichoderma aggressivum f. europaeum TaxID=173218 RepID=A0AAE1J2Z3_9HYPO|nr:hypothetical protein Triagg1_8964 [Trichoderma aggressivum f. europaeum]